jgi:hypothetical protein
MAEDRTELNDLSSAYPEKVTSMSTVWEAWFEETGPQKKEKSDKGQGTKKKKKKSEAVGKSSR